MHRIKLLIFRGLSFIMIMTIMMMGTGLHFFYHHCYTSGQHDFIISLPLTFQSDTDLHNHCHCTHANSDETQCEDCTAPANETNHIHSNYIDCCQTESKIIQLHIEYIVSQTPAIELPSQIWLFFQTFSPIFENYEAQAYTTAIKFFDIPPTPIYGKVLLTSLHQLKIHIA